MAEKIICLSISSYRGISLGATHWYGRMKPYDTDSDDEPWEVMRTLNAEEAEAMNELDRNAMLGDMSCGLEAGDKTVRFDSREAVIEAAKEQVHEEYGADAVLYLGNPYNIIEDLEEL